jgi:hypothetical protein
MAFGLKQSYAHIVSIIEQDISIKISSSIMVKLLEVLLVSAEGVVKVLLHVLNVLLLGDFLALEPAVRGLYFLPQTVESLAVASTHLVVPLLLVVYALHKLVYLHHQVGFHVAAPEGKILFQKLFLCLDLFFLLRFSQKVLLL